VSSQSSLQREYLGGLAGELGLEFLDITNYLQEAVVSSPLAYYPANVHLTEQGHALIARTLEPQLRRLWMLWRTRRDRWDSNLDG
jgi:lysophospholipase L1-like esterase